MNSPFGLEYSILKELNWTRDYLLWKISWVTVQMMLADAPRLKSGQAKTKGKELDSEDDFKEFLKL